MEESSFYDAGPKPDWALKETKPAIFPPPARGGPANFLRPGAARRGAPARSAALAIAR
jgi:hypothetical protein